MEFLWLLFPSPPLYLNLQLPLLPKAQIDSPIPSFSLLNDDTIWIWIPSFNFIISLQVVKALHETEETNARLHMYIEGLLANITEKYPELLEKKWTG